LLERVTDQQYAVINGGLRHLPRGVDEYLELRAKQRASGGSGGSAPATGSAAAAPAVPKLGGADLRNAQKEKAAAERKMEKLGARIAAIHERMATHDQSDYEGLADLSAELRELESSLAALETRWLELEELLG
jgi:hypothetical protein